MDDSESLKSELTKALYHEYGHEAVAASYGLISFVEVAQNKDYNPNRIGGDKRFYGTCSILGCSTLSDEQLLRIGLAGEVCEYLCELKDITTFYLENNLRDIYDIQDHIQDGSFSDTDQSLIGNYEFEDLQPVIDVVTILKSKWEDISSNVQREMEWTLSLIDD